jgi:endonuclease YncB( thermonuclease family)
MADAETRFRVQIHIRLAGVDAPELAHFGRPSQPFSQEAIDWLTSYIHLRRVRAYVYKRDQYDRAVATVYVRKWLLRRDVGLQMLRMGLATVYEAKTGAEFGMLEEKYRKAERWAKLRGRGMWGGKGGFESPRDYKTRMQGIEGEKK